MRCFFLVLFAFGWMPNDCQAFSPSAQKSSLFSPTTTRYARNPSILRMSNNDGDGSEDEEYLDNLLDKPFFDPDKYDENDSGPLGWFANLVKSDYELAETIYVGTIFVVLLEEGDYFRRLEIN
jgi:hypothetical protein